DLMTFSASLGAPSLPTHRVPRSHSCRSGGTHRIPNNLRFQEEPSIYTALVPRVDDPYVMVRDAAMDTQGGEDVDTDAPWDTQPSEPRGSLQEEYPEEDPEEYEIQDEDMVNDEEDDAEVINPYEEAYPHNRPPPTSDEETDLEVTLESSAMRDLLAGNSKVYAPGLMCYDLKSVHRGVMKLSKKMHDMYRTEKKMAKKLRQDKLRMNGQEFDITALDSTVRENRFKNSKMMMLITGLSREFTELKNQNRRMKI
nr:hypothetical protein [Tanacetum cinerariifolium]